MNRILGRQGNEIGDLLVDQARAAEVKREATGLRSIDIDDRQMCDLELLLSGSYAPLRGFMGQADYESVLQRQRLVGGEFFPMPITLAADAPTAESLKAGERVVLRDDEGAILALLTVEDVWMPDWQREREILDLNRESEVGAASAVERPRPYAVGGPLEGISLPVHHDYPDLRTSPKRLSGELEGSDMERVIVVDPTAELPPLRHRAIAAMAQELEALVLFQPAIGAAKPTDLELHRRIKRYRAALSHYPAGRARLALLPLARRGLGERELLWRALVYSNTGATHMFVDPRDYGLGEDAEGSEEVRALAARHFGDMGVDLLSIYDLRTPTEDLEGAGLITGSGRPVTDVDRGGPWAGDWQTGSQGFSCFFTGLSGAGKSTVARALAGRLAEAGRAVTLLDGDVVRRHLSSELTFSKEHRDLNIRRIGYVASEITRHGGAAICAPIAPYRVTRGAVRAMTEAVGHFLEIYVATPLDVCEERDPKGLYAKAHAGLIRQFTGIDDPYEAPEHPEILIDTSQTSVEEATAIILAELRRRGCLDGGEPALHEIAGGERSAG